MIFQNFFGSNFPQRRKDLQKFFQRFGTDLRTIKPQIQRLVSGQSSTIHSEEFYSSFIRYI